jgi:outer membrane protein assembly factor BamB
MMESAAAIGVARTYSRDLGRLAVTAFVLFALAGCATMAEYMPTIPSPSSWWPFNQKKIGPLPEVSTSATAIINWQASVGKGAPGFAPAVTTDAIYTANPQGTITRIDPANGRSVWSVSAGTSLSGGIGAGSGMLAVGTDKGEVYAFDESGKALWNVRVSTEVVAPPKISEGIVLVFTGDGNVTALNGKDGSRKWVFQRAPPPLTVRNYTGGIIYRGALFFGLAGGRLIALDLQSGLVGWEAVVANPKGSTELERIADITSLPIIDEPQLCAVAYQGRIACFDVTKGTLNWSRDVSSLTGLASDGKYIYVTDDKGAVHGLDKTTGASIWKQDRLADRRLGGPQLVGDNLGVVDGEGYLHLIARTNGAYVGRIATDGTPATAQPVVFLGSALWQSVGGNLYAIGSK